MMESVPGSHAAAPTPMMPRAAMSDPVLGARAPKTEPAMNTTAPASMTFLRPMPVAQGAEGEHEAGEHQGVGVDDPLQLGDAGVQGGLQVLERRRS